MNTTIPVRCSGCGTENWLSVGDILSKLRVLDSFTPIGQVLIWTGNKASIPEGWTIADGENGTSDLSSLAYHPYYYIQRTA